MGVEDGVFGIELKDLKLNFFNFIDVNINGYMPLTRGIKQVSQK